MKTKQLKHMIKTNRRVVDPKLAEKLEVFETVKKRLIPLAEEFTDNAIKNYLFSTLMALHDELGFGHKRLERVMNKIMFHADCIRDGLVSNTDMAETLKRETGFDLDTLVKKHLVKE